MAKIYINQALGEKPQKGIPVFHGKKGGLFYFSEHTRPSFANRKEHSVVKHPNGIMSFIGKHDKKSIETLGIRFKYIMDILPKKVSITDGKPIVLRIWNEKKAEKEWAVEDMEGTGGFYDGADGSIHLAAEDITLDITNQSSFKKIRKSLYEEDINDNLFTIYFLHELGHHIYARLEYESDWKSSVSSITNDKVTEYAGTNLMERFAESFLYYFLSPKKLKERDLLAYEFMRDVLFEKKGQPWLTKQMDREKDVPLGSLWEKTKLKTLFPMFFDKEYLIKSIDNFINKIENRL